MTGRWDGQRLARLPCAARHGLGLLSGEAAVHMRRVQVDQRVTVLGHELLARAEERVTARKTDPEGPGVVAVSAARQEEGLAPLPEIGVIPAVRVAVDQRVAGREHDASVLGKRNRVEIAAGRPTGYSGLCALV